MLNFFAKQYYEFKPNQSFCPIHNWYEANFVVSFQKILADNFSELPEDIKKRVRDAKLEEDVVNKSFPVLLSVLHFLTKDSYQTRDEVPVKKDHAPYATEQTMDTASTYPNDGLLLGSYLRLNFWRQKNNWI